MKSRLFTVNHADLNIVFPHTARLLALGFNNFALHLRDSNRTRVLRVRDRSIIFRRVNLIANFFAHPIASSSTKVCVYLAFNPYMIQWLQSAKWNRKITKTNKNKKNFKFNSNIIENFEISQIRLKSVKFAVMQYMMILMKFWLHLPANNTAGCVPAWKDHMLTSETHPCFIQCISLLLGPVRTAGESVRWFVTMCALDQKKLEIYNVEIESFSKYNRATNTSHIVRSRRTTSPIYW